MTNDEVTIEPGDPNSPYKGKSGPLKISNTEVAIFVGLLVGVGLVGCYLVGLGINNMIEPPKIIANGTIGLDYYPIFYEDSYYKSDKRNELVITNLQTWKANIVWLGSVEEYISYRDMKLMDGQIHEYHGKNGQFVENSIIYKRMLKYYNIYETPLANMVSSKQKIVLIVDNNLSAARIYDIELTGNVTTPIFNLKESNDVLPIGKNKSINTYYQ